MRALECAAAASFAAACVVTAGLLDGSAASLPLFVVAGAAGVAAGAMLWRERPPRAASVARRADARAGLEGALPTVLDVLQRAGRQEPQPQTSAVTGLLASRVAARVTARDLARAALPRSPLAIVAPLAGAALVALALERAAPPAVIPTSTASSGLRAAAQQSRARGATATADVLDAATRRVEAAERLPSGPEGDRARAAATAELARLAATLEARPDAPDRRLDSDLEAAAGRAALERAIAALDPRTDPSRGEPGGGSASSGGGEAGGGGGLRAGQGLANQPGDGRMLGPPAGGEPGTAQAGPVAGAAASGGPGRGVPAARWWPRRYDDVVERYLAP